MERYEGHENLSIGLAVASISKFHHCPIGAIGKRSESRIYADLSDFTDFHAAFSASSVIQNYQRRHLKKHCGRTQRNFRSWQELKNPRPLRNL